MSTTTPNTLTDSEKQRVKTLRLETELQRLLEPLDRPGFILSDISMEALVRAASILKELNGR